MNTGPTAILGQLAVLLTVVAGYGSLLWRLCGRPPPGRAGAWLWLGLAGFCLHGLLLQSLVYLGLPLRITAWPALVPAVAGLALAGRDWRRRRHPVGRRRRTEAFLMAAVFSGAFAIQAAGLFARGPARYYGNGHYDQANYVVTAQFLTDEPFATTVGQVGHRPWLLRALEAREERITQCVALGALAVASGTDSQAAYGVLSVFFVAVAGAAACAWLRTCGAPRWAAAVAGLAAALSPALTRIHLDGFFSQTATLFVFPALAATLGGRGVLRPEARVCAAIFVAFLVGAYTELAAPGVVLVGALVLVRREPMSFRLRWLAEILIGGLVLNPGYAVRLPLFLARQWRLATTPETLAALFPDSGTWAGWGRLYFDAPWPGVVVAAGIGVAILGCRGVAAMPSGRRPALAATVGGALAVLVVLRASPQFSPYVFAKVAVQFTPFWLGAAMLGWVALGRPWSRRAPWPRLGGLAALAGIAVTGFAQQLRVIRPEGVLAVLGSDDMLAARAVAAAHPERVFLVDNAQPLVAQWLCYHGRGSRVVFGRRNLGDRIVPTETHAFRRWSDRGVAMWRLDPENTGRADAYEPPPALRVSDAAETGRTDQGPYYVATAGLELVLERSSEPRAERVLWLDCVAIPLEAGKASSVELSDPAGRRQRTTVSAPGWRRWRVTVRPGRNVFRLSVAPDAPGGGASGKVLFRSFSVEDGSQAAPFDPPAVSLSAVVPSATSGA